MKKKQTYIIGDITPTKKITKPKQKKKPAKKNNKPVSNNQSTPINTAFADAFAKLGVSSKDFQKK